MIPPFEESGLLPPGIHAATWQEIAARFGGTERRDALLDGLHRALLALKAAGCRVAYVDGSFVSARENPGDYDGAWHLHEADLRRLDPTLFDFEAGRRAQKRKYGGEMFPAEFRVGPDGEYAVDFFQRDTRTGQRKGVIVIDLEQLR